MVSPLFTGTNAAILRTFEWNTFSSNITVYCSHSQKEMVETVRKFSEEDNPNQFVECLVYSKEKGVVMTGVCVNLPWQPDGPCRLHCASHLFINSIPSFLTVAEHGFDCPSKREIQRHWKLLQALVLQTRRKLFVFWCKGGIHTTSPLLSPPHQVYLLGTWTGVTIHSLTLLWLSFSAATLQSPYNLLVDYSHWQQPCVSLSLGMDGAAKGCLLEAYTARSCAKNV